MVFNMAAISGWHAFADQEALPIKRVNFAFMGVDVPVGEHLVWFEYRPWFSCLGSFISLCTIAICFGLFWRGSGRFM
jgi:uncharacterized membrane protein YfhO